METREILIYLSTKYEGNWDLIYDAIKRKEAFNFNDLEDSINKHTCGIVTLIDSNYPQPLKNITRPPFVLYYYGDLSLISNHILNVAVIGARDNTEYGKFATERIIKDLHKQVAVVSGLAKGIDSIAHKAAIDNNLQTVAVLGSGIELCYPDSSKQLYNQIKHERKGLLISEYPLNTEPKKENFPLRNRIVAGVSKLILVTEAYNKSGTSITVTAGLSYGRDVAAVPANIGSDSFCNQLIKEGAMSVSSGKDVNEILDL